MTNLSILVFWGICQDVTGLTPSKALSMRMAHTMNHVGMELVASMPGAGASFSRVTWGDLRPVDLTCGTCYGKIATHLLNVHMCSKVFTRVYVKNQICMFKFHKVRKRNGKRVLAHRQSFHAAAIGKFRSLHLYLTPKKHKKSLGILRCVYQNDHFDRNMSVVRHCFTKALQQKSFLKLDHPKYLWKSWKPQQLNTVQ